LLNKCLAVDVTNLFPYSLFIMGCASTKAAGIPCLVQNNEELTGTAGQAILTNQEKVKMREEFQLQYHNLLHRISDYERGTGQVK
jgi:hypothetical protein